MRGLYLEHGNLTFRTDLPEPPARPGWTRVRVTLAGICATDQALAKGYLGFTGVPGHEFVGVALDGRLRGRRVVGEINAGCGTCARCQAGDSRHCAERTVLGIVGQPGAFAEILSLPDRNLLAVPDEIDDVAATFTEPLAAALHLQTELGDRAPDRALVIGDGKLGILCAWALARLGHRVTMAGRHPERRALLPPSTAFATGLLETDRPAASVAPFPLAVDASGNPAVLPAVLPLLQPRGLVVLKTTTERPVTADLALVVIHELRIVGSRCGRFAPALAALAQHAVPVERLVAARYPLADGLTAFRHASSRGTLKVLLDLGSP
ncbi:MAG: alcohol dehydrogenase catalytic domain-containing protein [Planctomycetes bacterium]|nr:alcohol dehydrogenase catalytic domain-containing protein [Planctomycetota bacterium]